MMEFKESELKKIKNQYFKIIKKILSNPGYDAIIIYGSYGRNEGAWILKNKEMLPYNDFDIIVVTDNKISNNEKIEKIEKLKKQIKTQWIDLQYINNKYLQKMNKKTIFNYDLKFGSTVIYGNKNILEKIDIDESDKINIKDLEVLFNTRLWTLYGSYKDLNNLDEDKSLFLKYQLSKAILAVVDSYLIRKKIYNCHYREKVKLFIKENNKEDQNHLVKWALKEKLFPSLEILKKTEALDLIQKTKKVFFNEFFQSLSEIYKVKIEKIEDIITYRNTFGNKLKIILKYIIKREKNIFKKENLRKIEIILAFITEENETQALKKMLKRYANNLNIKYDSLENIREKIALKRFNT